MNQNNDIILRCHGITTCYTGCSEHAVLREVDISVEKGEIVGILGPNGSGKSSTLNSVMGHLRILCGEVYFGSEKVSGLHPEDVARKGVRLFPQGGRVFPDLTVEENLQVAASCVPRRHAVKKEKVFEWFPDLAPRKRTRAGLLSGGQKQLLSLGMVLLYMQVPESTVFLLDEPSGSLDPQNRNRLAEVLLEARDQYGASILIAEENAVFAKHVCSRFYRFVEPGQLEPFV